MNQEDQINNEREAREAEQDRKRRLEMKKEIETIARSTVYAIESMNRRHRAVEDPGTKYALLVDKLCTFLDIGGGILRGVMDDYEVDPAIQAKVEETHNGLLRELDALMKWIVNPRIYSPDHIFGNAVMRSAQNDFNNQNEN
jgi:hypothetical protein